MSHRPLHLLLASLLLCLAIPAVRADVPLDDFDDGNVVLEDWDGVWRALDAAADPEGFATGWHSNADNVIVWTRRAASIEAAGDGFAYQGGLDTVPTADPTPPPRRYQALMVHAERASAFDATPFRYLRFRAWHTAPPPAGATFVVSMAQDRSVPAFWNFPPVSYGPWSGPSDQTDLGIALTGEPREYLVDLATFTVDPNVDFLGRATRDANWAAAGSVGPRPNTFPGAADLSDVWSIGFGYQRRRQDATTAMSAAFRVDDIFFLENAPGVTATPDAVTTQEGGDAATVLISLAAVPTRDVLVLFSSGDPSEGTVAPATMTFTPADWNVPQELTITPVDDAVADGAVAYEVRMRLVSADNLYDGLAVAPIAVLNLDDDDTELLADHLVDDFEDGDFVTQPWGGGAWIAFDGEPDPTGFATAAHTGADGLLVADRAAADLLGDGDGFAFATEAIEVPASEPGDPTLAYQRLALGALRDGSFDATGYEYLRFRAWRVGEAPIGARFDVAIGGNPDEDEFASVPPTSFGPWTGDTGDPAVDLGLELGEEPTDFLVPLAAFAVDPLVDRLGHDARMAFWTAGGEVGPAPAAPGGVAFGDVWTVSLGMQRRGEAAADAMTAQFVIDDVAFLRVAPAAMAEASATDVVEGAAVPVTISVALAARPSRAVVVTATSSDPSQGTVSGPLTFLPASWDVPQAFTVEAVADGLLDGDQPFEVSFEVASDDQLHDGLPIASIAFMAIDVDALALVVAMPEDPLRVPEEGSASFTVVLNGPPVAGDVTVTPTIAGDADLALLDDAPFTFDTTNWDVPVTVTVTAARDDDYADGTAVVTLTAEGGLKVVLEVNVVEVDKGPSGGVVVR